MRQYQIIEHDHLRKTDDAMQWPSRTREEAERHVRAIHAARPPRLQVRYELRIEAVEVDGG